MREVKMAETLASKPRKYKPKVVFGVRVDTSEGPTPPGSHDWRKEEAKRIEAEIKALEAEIKNFDPKSVVEQAKKSLEVKLKMKKLRLEEHRLKMDGFSDY